MSRILSRIFAVRSYCIIFLLLASLDIFADSVTSFRESEGKTLLAALDVVEGSVVESSLKKQSSPNACFSYVYDLKVKKSYKGILSESEVIKVGLNLNSIAVEPEQKQLIVLTEAPEDFYEFCDKGSLEGGEDVKITFGHVIGVFEIYTGVSGGTKYRGISCNDKKPVMYEDYLGEKTWVTASCYQIKGPYKSLKEMIQKDISSS